MLDVFVLGPLRLIAEGTPVEVKRARERALLCLLIVHRPQVVSTDVLIEGVWGDNPPSNPGAALQTGISRLRRVLGPRTIRTSPGGYSLDPDLVAVDVDIFERLVTSQVSDSGELLARSEEALAMWRGTPFMEFAYDGFTQHESARLDELRMRAIEGRLRALLDLGRHEEAIPDLRVLVAQEPYREVFWGNLMLALYRAGRQADALAVYQRARKALGDVGLEPGVDLSLLEERILQQDADLAPDAQAISRRQAQVAPRLVPPVPVSSLVGRADELELLTEQVRRGRLVTVTGTGGVGKTRLILEASRLLADDFRDGVIYADLDQLDHPIPWSEVVASFAGPSSAGETPLEHVIEMLRRRHQLLILDGCERFLDEVPGFVSEVLAACPGTTLLIGSRHRLRLTAETVHPLLPLPLRQGEDPGAAAHLFIERAQGVRPQLDLDDAGLRTVHEIVAILDGLPLAIELAATHAAYVPLGELALQLERTAGMIESRDREAPERHRSVDAAIAVSWAMLDESERGALGALSLLQSPWELRTASLMIGLEPDEVAEVVARLADRSLLVPMFTSASVEEVRFRTLRSIRDFCRRRLEEAGTLHELEALHARVFLGFAQDVASALHDVATPLADYWSTMRVVEARLADLEAALRWFLAHEPDESLEFLAHMGMFLLQSQRKSEAARWFRLALDQTSGASAGRAEVMGMLGEAIRPGPYLELDVQSFSHPFSNWRDRRRFFPDDEARAGESVALLRAALDMFEAVDHREQDFTRLELARSTAVAGDLQGAEMIAGEVLGRATGRRDLACYARQILARIALAQGDPDEAEEWASGEACSDSSFNVGDVYSLDTIGRISLVRGDWERARGVYQQLLDGFAGPNDLAGVAILHLQLSFIAAMQRKPEAARIHAGKALSTSRRFAMPRIESMVRFAQGWSEYVGGNFDRAREYFEHSYQLSRGLQHEFGLGMALIAGGCALNALGTPDLALDSFKRAFGETNGLGGAVVESEALFYAAHSLHLRGQHDDAARLLGAADEQRTRVNMPWWEDWFRTPDPAAALIGVIGEERFEQAYSEGRRLDLSAAVAVLRGL